MNVIVFFIQMIDDTVLRRNGLSYFCDEPCLRKTDNSPVVYLIEEN